MERREDRERVRTENREKRMRQQGVEKTIGKGHHHCHSDSSSTALLLQRHEFPNLRYHSGSQLLKNFFYYNRQNLEVAFS